MAHFVYWILFVLISFRANASEQFNQEAVWAHETSSFYRQCKDSNEITEAAIKRIMQRLDQVLSSKEMRSIDHQHDLIGSLNPAVKQLLEKNGFNSQAYLRGVVDSDLGKLKKEAQLLTDGSPKSHFLINVLSGKGPKKVTDKLRRILDQMGFKNQWPFPPKLAASEISSLIEKHPILKGYFHEFPGMANAFMFYEKGILSDEEFELQVKANLFHNGPHAGFWARLGEEILPLVLKDEPRIKDFFTQTLYNSDKKSADGMVLPYYPLPQSFEGLVHAFYDRMSQATEGGVTKIFDELEDMQEHSLDKMHGLLYQNVTDSILQIQQLTGQAKRILTPAQEQAFASILQSGLERLNKYQSYIRERVELKFSSQSKTDKAHIQQMTFKLQEGNQVQFVHNQNQLSMRHQDKNGKILTEKTYKDGVRSATASFEKDLNHWVQQFIHQEHVLNGDPVRGLVP